MSRTFLNQSTQIANSESYEDTLSIGSTMEYTRADEKTIHDDLNALRTMIRVALGTSKWYDAPASNIESLEMSKVSKAGDTMTGPLDMGSNPITNLMSPTNENDAATKLYVDTVAGGIPVRVGRIFARVTAACSAGNDLLGIGPAPNLDNGLPMFSAATFASGYDIFMNGQLLRPGSDYDVIIGGSGDNEAMLKLTYDAVVGDVICVISYAAPGYTPPFTGNVLSYTESGGAGTIALSGYSPVVGDTLTFGVQAKIVASVAAGLATISGIFNPAPAVGVDTVTITPAGGGGGGGGGTPSYTVSYYNDTDPSMVYIGLSDGTSNDVSLTYTKNVSTVTVNGETSTLGGSNGSLIAGVMHYTYVVNTPFTSAPSVGDSVTFTA